MEGLVISDHQRDRRKNTIQIFIYKVVFINLQVLVLIAISQFKEQFSIIQFINLVLALILIFLKSKRTIINQETLIGQDQILTKQAIERVNVIVLVSICIMNTLTFILKLVYFIGKFDVKSELKLYLDLDQDHKTQLDFLVFQSILLIINIGSLIFFKPIHQKVQKIKRSFLDRSNITKKLLVLLYSIQPILNLSVSGCINFYFLSVMVSTFFFSCSIYVYKGLCVANIIFYLVQYSVRDEFYVNNNKYNNFMSIYSDINQIFIIYLLTTQSKIIEYDQIYSQQFQKDIIINRQKSQTWINDMTNKISKFMKSVYDNIFNSKTVNVYISLIVSVVVVQRYDSYFSLVQITFIFTQFFIKRLNLKIGVYITQIVFNYYRLIVQIICSIQYNQVHLVSDQTVNKYNKLEFKRFDNKYLDYLIQIFNILLVFNMIQYAIYIDKKSQEKEIKEEDKQQQSQIYEILCSIFNESLFLISFLISIFILFWVSLYAINIVHFILALYFVFILLNLNTGIFRIGEDKSNKLRKYWFSLIIFIQLIILLKYFTEIYLSQETKKRNEDLLEFLGVDFNYNFPFKIGLTKEDFGSNTLLWILYIFSIKFYIFIEDSSNNLQEQTVTEKIFNRVFNLFNILYIKIFFYLVYFIFLGVIVFMKFNFIRLLILMILMIPMTSFITNMNESKNNKYYGKQVFYWNLLMVVVSFSTLAVYFYQFFQTHLISKITKNNQILKFIDEHQFIGFVFSDNPQFDQQGIKYGGLKVLMLPYYLFILICVLSRKQLRLITSNYVQNQKNSYVINLDDDNIEQGMDDKPNHNESSQQMGLEFSIRQNDSEVMSKILNGPLFDQKKHSEIIKLIYFVSKFFSAFQMIFVLLITRTQLTICSFIIMLIFIRYNWKFVLNPEKFYNSKKMIDETNKCLEIFKNRYLDKECFRMTVGNDSQIIELESKVKKIEYDYIQKKHQSKLKMNEYLIRILMFFITLSFIVKILEYDLGSRIQDYEVIEQYLSLIGIFDKTTNYYILTFFSIIWMSVLDLKMLDFIQDQRQIKHQQIQKDQEKEQIFINSKDKPNQSIEELQIVEEVSEFNCQNRILEFKGDGQDYEIFDKYQQSINLDNYFQIEIYNVDEQVEIVNDYIKKVKVEEKSVQKYRYFNYYKLQSFYKNQKFYEQSIFDQTIIVLIDFIGVILGFVLTKSVTTIYEILILILALIQLKISNQKAHIIKIMMLIITQVRYIGIVLASFKVTRDMIDQNIQNKQFLGLVTLTNSDLIVGIYFLILHLCLKTKFKITKQISTQLYENCMKNKKIDYRKVNRINLNYSQWRNEQISIRSSFIYFMLNNYLYVIFFMMMILLNNQTRNLVGFIQIILLLIFVFYEQLKTKSNYDQTQIKQNSQNNMKYQRSNTNRRLKIQMEISLSDYNVQPQQSQQVEGQCNKDNHSLDQISDRDQQKTSSKLKQKHKVRFIFICIMQIILGINYFVNSTSNLQIIEFIVKYFKVEQSSFNSFLMIIILTFMETLIRVLSWPFMINQMNDQNQDSKVAKILRCYLTYSNKNKTKIDKIYQQEFTKNKLLMNVEILTQKYQQLFNSLENNKNNVQQDDIANIMKDKQGVNDNLINQSSSQTETESVQSMEYDKMNLMQKVYTSLNKQINEELKDTNIQLYNRFLKQNKNLIDIQKLSLTDYITQDYNLIKKQIYEVIQKQNDYFQNLKLIQVNQSKEKISFEIEQLHHEFIQNNKIHCQDQNEQEINSYEQSDLQFLQIQLPQKIQIFNFNVDDSYVNSNYSFQKILDLLIRVVLSKQVYILLSFLLFYRFYSFGLLSILPILIILFLNFIQQSEFKVYYYFMIYSLISVIIIMKYFFQIEFIRQLEEYDLESKMQIYIGEGQQFMFEVMVITLIIIRVQILKLSGLLRKQNNYYNNTFQYFFIRILNQDQDKHSNIKPDNMKSVDETNLNQDFLQQVNTRSSQILQKQFLNSLQVKNLHKNENYLYRNFSSIVIKCGVDYYSSIFTIQLIILVYILFFYKKMMINNQIQQQNIDGTRFDGNLLTPLILQILVMIVDRVINQRKDMKQTIVYKINISNELIKFIFMIFQVIFIVSYLISISQTDTFDQVCTFTKDRKQVCYRVKVNIYQNIFYLLYFMYFTLCAFQIRYGYPKENRSNSLIEKYNYVHLITFYILQAIPFVYEIKILIDWTISNTSLTITQWFQVSQIRSKLFVAKVFSRYQQMSEQIESIAVYLKFLLGFCGLFMIFILLLGPIFVYSSLNPIGQVNPVNNVNIKLGINMNHTHIYQLYSSSYNQKITDMNQTQEDQLGIQKNYQFSDNSVFQVVSASPFSEIDWSISSPAKKQLIDELNKIVLNNSTQFQISFFFQVTFVRKQTKDIDESSTIYKRVDDLDTIRVIRNNIINCSYTSPILIQDFYENTYQLMNNHEPVNFNIGKHKTNFIELKMHCDQNKVGTEYWSLQYQNQQHLQYDGIYFYTISDSFNMYLMKYSLSGFYFSIVYLVFTIIRSNIQTMTSDYTLTNLPYPDNLIKICKAIEFSRQDDNLELEYTLYWYLMDLLRSPEIVKMMTGSYYKIISRFKKRQ